MKYRMPASTEKRDEGAMKCSQAPAQLCGNNRARQLHHDEMRRQLTTTS
jgi:hypothetical protein